MRSAHGGWENHGKAGMADIHRMKALGGDVFSIAFFNRAS
jgi:hypothetical protein